MDGHQKQPRVAPLPWSNDGWLADAIAWIDALVERKREPELESARPWAAVIRVPTATGNVWFKEVAPALAFEPALTAWLAERRPDCTAAVLAAEGTRLLTTDAGPSVVSLLEAGRPAPSFEKIVALYAELQIELAGSVDELLALGVPDNRPDALGFPVEGPVPLSLIHEEVHACNVLARAGKPVFIDWGEGSVSHPFAGLLNTLRTVGNHFDWEPGGPQLLRLRDTYLEPWTLYAPLAELREVFAAGYALGALARAATWTRVLSAIPQDQREDYEHNIAVWREWHHEALRSGIWGH